ncbi:MAG: radical SAM protein [Candidatus Omnitrophota bacterium]
MNILLIAPSVKQSASYKYPDGIARSMSRNFGIYPWLGLSYLAAYIQNSDFKVEIIDMDAAHLSIPGLVRLIRRKKPDIIGIASMTFTFIYVLKLARAIKKVYSAPIIIGGAHVSIYPELVMQHTCFDIGVIGEGEQTFAQLLNYFKEKPTALGGDHKSLGDIDGLAFKFGQEVVITKPRELIADIDSLPLPVVNFLPIDRYYGCNHIKPYLTMVTARGCRFNCDFCSKTPWGNSFRYHSAERVVDEIEYYVNKLGIKAIDFYDDTFTIPRDRIEKIISLIHQRNLKFDFGCMTRIDCVDNDLLKGLRQAGCTVIAFGIEFGNQRIQEQVNKKLSFDNIKKVFASARQIGIATVGFFMIGHPDETEADIKQTMDLMSRLPADYVKTNILIPYPQSPLYRRLLSDRILPHDFWAELTKGNILGVKDLIHSRVGLARLVQLRNQMNRLSYTKQQSNLFKFNKIKSIQDVHRSLSIILGTYFDDKV